MPAKIWHKDSTIDDMQRQSRYFEASNLIYRQADKIAELEAQYQTSCKSWRDLVQVKENKIAELESLNDWLTDIQITAAKLDNEQRKSIAELEKALVKVELFLEVTASPVFILAEHDYPLSIGPKSNSIELEIIKSTVSKAKGGAE